MNLDAFISNKYTQGVLIGSFLYNFRGNISNLIETARNVKTFIFFYKFFNSREVFQNQIQLGFRMLSILPSVKKKIDSEISENVQKISEDLSKDSLEIVKLLDYKIPISTFPFEGIENSRIIETLQKLKKFDDSTIDKGKVSGTIYSDNDKIEELIASISNLYFKTNPLHPDIFPTLRYIEKWLIRKTLRLFNAADEGRASITSGGTESIFLACKTYKTYYKNIRNPEIIVPETAHPAFDKACECLGIKLVKVPIEYSYNGIEASKLNLSYYKSKINENTICLVGSAPSFPHGEIDPMREIGKLGVYYNIPVHMDCCLGGFLLPFLDLNEFYDFSMPGITSISADFHKYAYCEKGISIVMYSHYKYSNSQYFIYDSWNGGIYATNTLLGSRPGNIIVLTWATLMSNGINYYRDASLKIREATRKIARKIRDIEYLDVIGVPEELVNIVAIRSDYVDIYKINDFLKKNGWNLNALQFPSSIHLCVTLNHVSDDKIDELIAFLKIGAMDYDNILKKGDTSGGSIYGTSQKISNRSFVKTLACEYLDILYKG